MKTFARFFTFAVAMLVITTLIPAGSARAAATASDNACSAGYSGTDGSWTNVNGGTGFALWSNRIIAGSGSFLRGSSTVNGGGTNIDTSCSGGFAWGVLAGGGNGNTASVVRAFTAGSTPTNALQVGQAFQIDFDCNYVDNSNPVGFALQNSSGQNVFDFTYRASQGFQTNGLAVNGASSANCGVTYKAGNGLRLIFTLTATNTCRLQCLNPSNSTTIATFPMISLQNPAGGQAIDRVKLFSWGIGSGNNWNAYFNSMSVGCPTFTATVPSTNVCSGSTASFTVSASMQVPLTYQWQVSTDNGTNWNPVSGGSGATTATYTTPTLVAGDNGNQYRAVLTDICGNAINSAAAILTVISTPYIITQPTGRIADTGGSVTYSVVAAATSYQWYKGPTGSGVALTNGGSVSGATTPALTLRNLTSGDNGASFYVVVNACAGPPQTSAGAPLVVVTVDPFLKANGLNVRNGHGTGDIVPLRGANLGGWLVMENFMCPMDSSGLPDVYSVLETLDNRFGVTAEQSLMRTYQYNWIMASDLDNIRAMGMNVVRVPFWWANLQKLDGTWRPDAFDRLDWVVSNAWQRGLYTIIDFHGVPGGQSTADHTGRADQNQYWTSSSNQTATAMIWSNVAAHFVGNPAVAAYDLMNEPYGAPTEIAIWAAYSNLYQVVRSVDPDHIILMEATWKGTATNGASLNWVWDVLPPPSLYGWSNVVY